MIKDQGLSSQQNSKESSSQYQWLCQKVKELGPQPTLGPRESIFSGNLKTGYSINFPVALTCHPTSICANNCYASKNGKPITFLVSLKKQLRLYNYFLSENPQTVANRIVSEYHKKRLTWLRWNGSGDLFPEATGVVKEICRADKKVKLLIVTRKLEFIVDIPKTKNIYLMFSVDASSYNRMNEAKKVGHPRLYFSFLRTNKDDDTSGCQIIFNLQSLKKVLPFDDKKRCCPVDAGQLALLDGCNQCKKCFSERILKT